LHLSRKPILLNAFSLRSSSGKNVGNGFEQNFQVEPERPVVNVFQIEADPVLEIGNLVAAADLPETGEAGLDAQAAAMRQVVETLHLVHRQRARADGVDVAPVFFRLRMNERIAVNFRGRGDEEARFFFLGEAERADLQGLDRQFEIINRAGGRGEMPDIIHRAFEKNKFGHVLLDEFEIRVAAEVRDVVHAASDKIINADDLVAARNEQVGQVRAKEAGGAGDDGRGWF